MATLVETRKQSAIYFLVFTLVAVTITLFLLREIEGDALNVRASIELQFRSISDD